MLSHKTKIKIFDAFLEEEKSYADSFNGDIYISGLNSDYKFLNKLDTKESIKFWIQKLKSRLVMKEDDALIEDIIDDYIEFG